MATLRLSLTLGLGVLTAGCAVSMPGPSGIAPSIASGAPSDASSDTAASPSATEPDGTFAYEAVILDCLGECRTFSISDARTEPADFARLIDGAVLIEPDGAAWLCERLTDSSPPSCDGRRLVFENIDLFGEVSPSPLDNAQQLDGVRWLSDVTLPGFVHAVGDEADQ